MAIIFITSLLLTQTISFYSFVHAQSSPISLEVLPASVELPTTKKKATVLVIFRNTSTTDSLQKIKLHWLSNIHSSNLNIKTDITSINTLLPGGEFASTVELYQTKQEEEILGKIYFLIDYQKGVGISKVASTILEVKSYSEKKIEELADLKLKTTSEILNENRSALAYLIVKNKSYFPIRIKQVVPSGPSFILFKDSSNSSASYTQNQPINIEKDISPNTTYSIPIDVKAGQQIKPGKHTILFDVQLKWKQNGEDQLGTLILEKELIVGVFGEPAILELLKVPSLFILPGFLVLMTFRQLWIWHWCRANDADAEFVLKSDRPEFWFFGVFISLAIAVFYNLILKKNYLEEYGTNDIFVLWVYSICLGLIFYLIWSLGQNWWKQQITLNAKDDPITILKKLHRCKLSAFLDRVKFEGKERNGFLVAPIGSLIEKTHWVIPPIALKYQEPQALIDLPENAGWRPNIERWVKKNIVYKIIGTPQANFEQLKSKIEAQRQQQEHANELAKLLQEGQRRGFLSFSWDNLGWIKQPTESTQFGDRLQQNDPPKRGTIVSITEV